MLNNDSQYVCFLIFIKGFYLLMATIRTKGREQLRVWWRAPTCIFTINNTKVHTEIIQTTRRFHDLYLSYYTEVEVLITTAPCQAKNKTFSLGKNYKFAIFSLHVFTSKIAYIKPKR